jgi:hypothetical protein
MSATAVMYHVAPSSARDDIAADGLWARTGGEDDDPAEEGVYLFDNLGDAERFIPWVQANWPDYGPADVWQVNLGALERDPDFFSNLTDQVIEDPLETGGWMYAERHLDAERLALLRSGI